MLRNLLLTAGIAIHLSFFNKVLTVLVTLYTSRKAIIGASIYGAHLYVQVYYRYVGSQFVGRLHWTSNAEQVLHIVLNSE